MRSEIGDVKFFGGRWLCGQSSCRGCIFVTPDAAIFSFRTSNIPCDVSASVICSNSSLSAKLNKPVPHPYSRRASDVWAEQLYGWHLPLQSAVYLLGVRVPVFCAFIKICHAQFSNVSLTLAKTNLRMRHRGCDGQRRRTYTPSGGWRWRHLL